MQKTERNDEIEITGEEMSDMVEKLKAIDLSVSDEFDKFKYSMMLKSRFDIFNNARRQANTSETKMICSKCWKMTRFPISTITEVLLSVCSGISISP